MSTHQFVRATSVLLAFGWLGSWSVAAGELHEAVKADDLAKVQQLISRGVDINESNQFGPALDIAAARGAVKIAELLIDAGADIERATEKGGLRPLHLAAFRKDGAEMAALLINHGARIDAQNAEGRTPLIVAADNNSAKVASVLITAGADPEGADGQYHDTPLLWAAMDGHIEVAQVLLSKGAGINFKAGPDGDTPLHYAALDRRLEMIEFLVKNGADLNARNNKGKTPLQRASGEDVKELLKRLGAKE